MSGSEAPPSARWGSQAKLFQLQTSVRLHASVRYTASPACLQRGRVHPGRPHIPHATPALAHSSIFLQAQLYSKFLDPRLLLLFTNPESLLLL